MRGRMGSISPCSRTRGTVWPTQLLVERTCEAIVLDGQARLRYRGAIDDQYGQGTRKDAPTAHYVRDALDAILADRAVAVAATPVAGCLIDRVEVKTAGPGKGKLPGFDRPRRRSWPPWRRSRGSSRSTSAG